MLDWLIVGGGIHGVHQAVRLVGEAGVDPERLAIVDPADALLASWRRCVGNTGMTHLRSPGVHHLGIEPFELLRFDGGGKGLTVTKRDFKRPYNQPSVELFAAHCDEVIERHGLADCHHVGKVERIEPHDDRVDVQLADGTCLQARRVVLALGAAEHPCRPRWAEGLASVRHIFEPGFVLDPEAVPQRVAVVGGGITAAQVALRLSRTHTVHRVTRHGLRTEMFDSDPGWIGRKYMVGYLEIDDLGLRRRIIGAARHSGSVPPSIARRLRGAVERGAIVEHLTEVLSASGDPLVLELADGKLEVDQVLLATGFERRRPGGALVDGLVHEHGLQCAACGYPVVDENLRWHPRVAVTGPLAELELGPVARNIIGARRAAERIVAWAKTG